MGEALEKLKGRCKITGMKLEPLLNNSEEASRGIYKLTNEEELSFVKEMNDGKLKIISGYKPDKTEIGQEISRRKITEIELPLFEDDERNVLHEKQVRLLTGFMVVKEDNNNKSTGIGTSTHHYIDKTNAEFELITTDLDIIHKGKSRIAIAVNSKHFQCDKNNVSPIFGAYDYSDLIRADGKRVTEHNWSRDSVYSNYEKYLIITQARYQNTDILSKAINDIIGPDFNKSKIKITQDKATNRNIYERVHVRALYRKADNEIQDKDGKFNVELIVVGYKVKAKSYPESRMIDYTTLEVEDIGPIFVSKDGEMRDIK